MSHHPLEERVWLVDENDQPVGEGWQLRDGSKNWHNYRVVNVFIRNSEGKLWIPRRGPNKRIFPNCLDMSMGGHVDWPETYEQAFERELKEELNLDAKNVNAKFLGQLTTAEHPELSALMKVWEIQMDEAPDYNPEDFTEAFWLSPEEFRAKLAAGDKAKGDLLPLINIFYSA